MSQRSVGLTLFGEGAEGLYVYIGTSVLWTLTCVDPYDRTPLDLTLGSVKMGLTPFDITGGIVEPTIGSWVATPVGAPTLGICAVTWLPADTASVIVAPGLAPAPLPPGIYFLDVWRTDGAGYRVPLLAPSLIDIRAVSTLPP